MFYHEQQQIDFLNKKEVQILLSNIKNQKHKLIVLLMLDAGLRVSECVTLKLSNFDFKKKILVVHSLKKKGKSNKYRKIPLSARLYRCLADYLYKKEINQEDYLFPSDNSTPGHIRRQTVNKFLARYREKLNIQQLHPHALRHTCATQQLASGAELIHIKEMLGHEKLDTTTIYTHIPEEILRNNVDKATANKKSIFDRLKNLLIKPKKEKLISIPHNYNLPAIGRTEEINRINSYVSRDINVLITGEIGIGKSHLLEFIQTEKKTLKLDDTLNFKKSLIYLILYILDNDKEALRELLFSDLDTSKIETKLNRESIKNLCAEIKKMVEPKNYILQIDNVDRIPPQAIRALEELKDTFTIITTAREIPLNKASFVWNFERIQLKPLKRRFALDLINRITYDLNVEDYELFRNHIYEQSNGNPRVIFELTERYRKEPVLTNEVIREIKHLGSLKEIDMKIFIFFFIGFV